MPNAHGSFIWYELLTRDVDAAAEFYRDVVHWAAAPFAGETSPDGGIDYRIFAAADGAIAGLMKAPAAEMAPRWLGYIGVDDVDAAAVDIAASGGTVQVPPTDIPGIGRFAFLLDRDGVPFYVMRGASEGTSGSFSPTGIGHCSWNELVAGDMAGALDFYLGRFGWTRGDVMPMGPMGDYQFVHHGGERIGAVMQAPTGVTPAWNFYFRVADIDQAAAAVTAGGGTIRHGPIDVPGGDWVVQGTDPQGADFGLVGRRK